MVRFTVSVAIVASTTAMAPADTVSFQQGVNSYAGCTDTYLDNSSPDTPHGVEESVIVDHDIGDPGHPDPERHGLVRFGDVFGVQPGQIPPGAEILSAILTVDVTDPSGDDSQTDLHRLLVPWDESIDTWSSFVSGLDQPGVEYEGIPDVSTTGMNAVGPLQIDVTISLQAWSDGSANNGWGFIAQPDVGNGWFFRSSEYVSDTALRPRLDV